jgi:hypothetical protein
VKLCLFDIHRRYCPGAPCQAAIAFYGPREGLATLPPCLRHQAVDTR